MRCEGSGGLPRRLEHVAQVQVALNAGTHVLTFHYAARPAFALKTVATATTCWATYCITPAEAARAMDKRGLRGSLMVKKYTAPVAPNNIPSLTSTLRMRKSAGTTTIVCDARGMALIDPIGETTVRPCEDGAVHVLRISRPG